MAQLNDTLVQGDLRVTGTMYGTQSATVVSNANLAVPPISTTSNTSTVGDYSVYYGANKYLPDSTNNYNIHTVATNFGSSMYRATQIATASSSDKPSLLYERSAVSSDGVAWTFGNWKGISFTDHTHGNISNTGTLTDTAAAAAGNDYVVIRDADNAKIQTSTIKGTDVADAISKKHSHSTLTLSTTPTAYDGSHTLALPSSDPYTSARTPASHTHGNIANGGTLTDTAAAAAGNDYVFIRDADNAKIQTSTIKGTDVADAVSKKHSHSSLTLSTSAQAYDGSNTLKLPASDPYTSSRTPTAHASSETTYGIGSTSNHGHVKLSANIAPTGIDTSGSTAVAWKSWDFSNDSTSSVKAWNSLTQNSMVQITGSPSASSDSTSPENGRINAISMSSDGQCVQLAMGWDLNYRYKKANQTSWEAWEHVVRSSTIKRIVVDTVLGSDPETVYILA